MLGPSLYMEKNESTPFMEFSCCLAFFMSVCGGGGAAVNNQASLNTHVIYPQLEVEEIAVMRWIEAFN